jgi:hypothetical protein
VVCCLLLPTFSSIAQTVQWEVWNEKWPVNVSINPSNSIGVYLASNFGKLGEYAQKRLEKLLSDPAAQAKLSAKAIEYLVSEVIGELPQIAPKKHQVPSLWQGGMRCRGRPV